MKKYILLLIIIGFISCEKEIDIDIEDSESKVIIEANVSTTINNSKVKITRSLNLDDPLPYPTVSTALVSITDITNGEIFNLFETENGIYRNPDLLGIEGHAYSLSVTVDEIIYSASSTMPQLIVLESLEQVGEVSNGEGGGPGSGFSDSDYVEVIPGYLDPEGFTNYYQFIVTRNDSILGDVFIHSDFAFNGLQNSRSLNIEAEIGDVLTIDMQCVDETVYDYLISLNENINQSSATPANPLSNLNNNALGYFKAHTSSTDVITIE